MVHTWYLIVVNIYTSLVLALGTTRNIDGAADQSNSIGIRRSDLAFLFADQSPISWVSTLATHLIHVSGCPTFGNSKLNWNILPFQVAPTPGCVLNHPVVVQPVV